MDKNKELMAALLRGNKSLNIVPCSLKDGKSLIACQSGKKKVYSFYFKINFFYIFILKQAISKKHCCKGEWGNKGWETEGKQRKDSEPAISTIRHIQRGLCCDTVRSPLLTGEEAQQMHWDVS